MYNGIRSEINPLSIAAITNIVFRRLSQDEQFQITVEETCGEMTPGQWLTTRAIEAYKKGIDATQTEFLNFSPHGMWMILHNKKAPRFIKCTEEEFLSKAESIDTITKKMNDLIPTILLQDPEAEKLWFQLKEDRNRMINELEGLLDNKAEVQ